MKIKVVDKKGIYGRDESLNNQSIEGVPIYISPEGYEGAKSAVLKAVKTMFRNNQLDPSIIVDITIYPTSILIDSLDQKKLKTGIYRIAQKQTEMQRTDGSYDNGIEYELSFYKAVDSLYENIHAKRERIKKGSGERMRRPGEEGRPTKKDFKNAAKTAKK